MVEMKNKWWIIALVLAICVIGVAFFALSGQQNIILSETQTNGIQVSGTGEIYVSPDKAVITVGVVTQKTNSNDAQNTNSQVMNNVINAVKSKGVDEKSIKTVRYDVSPEYDETYTKIVSFSVYNVIMLETTDITKAGEILQAAGDAGANTNFNISFGLQDPDSVYNEALKIAVEDAKNKAQTIAGAAGKGLGDLISIEENYNSSVDDEYLNSRLYTNEDTASGSEVSIESGQLQVVVNVSAVYSVK